MLLRARCLLCGAKTKAHHIEAEFAWTSNKSVLSLLGQWPLLDTIQTISTNENDSDSESNNNTDLLTWVMWWCVWKLDLMIISLRATSKSNRKHSSKRVIVRLAYVPSTRLHRKTRVLPIGQVSKRLRSSTESTIATHIHGVDPLVDEGHSLTLRGKRIFEWVVCKKRTFWCQKLYANCIQSARKIANHWSSSSVSMLQIRSSFLSLMIIQRQRLMQNWVQLELLSKTLIKTFENKFR
jgi:hypothetical protein